MPPPKKLFSRIFTLPGRTNSLCRLHGHNNKQLLNCIFSTSLTNNLANLTKRRPQSLKVQVATKDIKKEEGFTRNLHPPETYCVKGVFQIQTTISCVNVSVNISIPQIRVNLRETEHDTTFETS